MPHLSRRALLGAGAAVLAGRAPILRAQTRDIRVFVGTFTDAFGTLVPAYFDRKPPAHRSRGLYVFPFNTHTGRAGDITLAAELSNPFNLTIHPDRRVIYACRWPTPPDGRNLTALAIEGDSLRQLNSTRSGGAGPNVGVVDRAGRHLLITNFISDNIVCIRLHADGSLADRSAVIGPLDEAPAAASPTAALARPSPGHDREDVPGGPHAVVLSRTERFAIAPEIHANRCRVMRFDGARGSLETHQLAMDAAGAGPRHLVWHPSYRYLYTAGETGSSISAWRWHEDTGDLQLIHHRSTRPDGFAGGNTTADIAMHPSGRFVYVTNRGAGSLTGFRIDPSTGRLAAVDHADLGSPSSWSMACDPSGQWALATAQLGDEIVVYAVGRRTGRLTPTGQTLPVGSPSCLRWA